MTIQKNSDPLTARFSRTMREAYGEGAKLHIPPEPSRFQRAFTAVVNLFVNLYEKLL